MVIWVSGSRSITSFGLVAKLIVASGLEITELAHGDQPGVRVGDKWLETVDRLAARWAKARGIPVKPVEAEWKKWGLKAGPIRNGQGLMWVRDRAIDLGDEPGCLCLHDGHSRGTKDSFDKARNVYGMMTCLVTVSAKEAKFEYFNSDRQNFVLQIS